MLALFLGIATSQSWLGASPAQARATLPLSVLHLKMGVSRPDDVRAMLRRAGATVSESRRDGYSTPVIEARNGHYPGINPRHDRIEFTFDEAAPNRLDQIAIYYGNASERFEYARMDEFTRRWNVSDGGIAMTWHGIVRGVSITLWREQETRELSETYTVHKEPANP